MERRLAITYSVSATATLGVACFAIAAVGGGLFASASPKKAAGGKSVEFVDDYIVLHSSTTLAPTDTTLLVDLGNVPAPAPSGSTHVASGAAAPIAAAPIAPAPPADSPAAANVPADAPASGPAPAATDPAVPPPSASTPAPAPAPATTLPKSTTTAPKPAPAPAPAPATTAPRSTTTVPTTSSTLPPGVQIPSDWPPGTPIPPIPAGCQQPQLEDNGVWNCQ